ncbi:ABC transporter permease [Tumebacillus sp. DT12]|uniref:ABC transporter permease n=1 Tax=Tumebacillus lacus TaxID=2995335 RepID=A0ABT3XBH7_9BACL|nr:ABC transporter permease [Tumebacillus lacus]MCX7572119.1 ABC transporter permease [Tumebacillus lacus]
MGNAQKALVMAAGIFLAIALITIAVIMFISAQEATKSAQNNFSSIQTELSATVFAGYDETIVSGSQVVNALRKFEQQPQFGILVRTGRNPGGQWYINTVSTSGTTKGTVTIGKPTDSSLDPTVNTSATKESSTNYVNPSGRFHSSLVYDASNNVRAIIFRQEGVAP